MKINIVTFDGDGNGATTLQTKIQLWNRAGNGWPDVIFSEQVNDPVWMAQKPFDFAAPIEEPHPRGHAQPVAGALDRPVHGRRQAVLRPGQPRPGGALGEPEEDGRRSATPSPRPGRSGRRWARRSPPSTRATSSATSATPSATGSTCGATSARSSSSTATTCTINADRRALHRDGEPARPADQERHAAAAQRVHPGLRQAVRRRGRQGADDARDRPGTRRRCSTRPCTSRPAR